MQYKHLAIGGSFFSSFLATTAYGAFQQVTPDFDREYEQKVSRYYIEYCTSTAAKRVGIPDHQEYGHTFVYVHGVCLASINF